MGAECPLFVTLPIALQPIYHRLTTALVQSDERRGRQGFPTNHGGIMLFRTNATMLKVLRRLLLLAIAATLLVGAGSPDIKRLRSVARAEAAGGSARLDLGRNHTCAMRPPGLYTEPVRCFGDNSAGQLGNSSLTNDLGAGSVRSVSAGDTATCVNQRNGAPSTIRCFGAGVPATLNNFQFFSVGKNGVCAKGFETSRIALKCYGVDDGSGWDGGAQPVSFGTDANRQPVDIQQLALSGSNSCALFYDGGVRCWGLSTSPVLAGSSLTQDIPGLPALKYIAVSPEVGCGLADSGEVYCWGSTTTGVATGSIATALALPGPAKAIAVGGQGACTLMAGGTITCWGGEFGAIGSATSNINLATDAAGAPAVATDVAMAENHTCAMLTTFEVRCWGLASLLAGSSKTVSVPFVEIPLVVIASGPEYGSTITTDTATLNAVAIPSAGVTFECSRDGFQTSTICTMPFTLSGMSDGSQGLAVRARNALGLSQSAEWRFNVDLAHSFIPITPERLLDTRPTAMAPGQVRDIQVTGVAGVPARATAVSLNVAAVDPVNAGHLRVYPSGSIPTASVLNFGAGKNTPNHVIVPVGYGGSISVYAGDTTNVIVDINGYFIGNASLDEYVPVATPTRIQVPALLPGARAGTTPAATAPSSIDVTVLGVGGIPATGVSTVLVNVGALNPTANGHLRVYSTGSGLPETSTHNFSASDSRMNLVIVKPGAGGKITVYNAAGGPVTITVDTIGYFKTGGQGFKPAGPIRAIDTRELRFGDGTPVAPGDFREVRIRGFGGVPDNPNVKTVVINVAAVTPAGSGSIDVGPSGANPTLPSFMHPTGENVANLVVVPIGADGKIRIVNNSAATSHIIADITGYFIE
jgi:hypothetical protein